MTPDNDLKYAQRYFQQAQSVAASGRLDIAIELMLEGLNLDPENTDQHAVLRTLALKRTSLGSKPVGILQRIKFRTRTANHKRNMLNAERLLAFDPANTTYMATLAENALRAGFTNAASWISNVIENATETT